MIRKLNTVIISLAIILTYITYVTEKELGLGEFYAEGIPFVFFNIFYIYSLLKYFENGKVSTFPLLMSLYLIYLISITFVYIFFYDKNFIIILFSYQYVILIIVMGSENDLIRLKYSLNYDLVLIFIALMGIISSVFGVIQILNISQLIPIDINRARGLSRSTLNYSSIIYIALVASFCIKNHTFKYLAVTINFMGLLASQGRSGILAALIFLIIYNFWNLKNTIVKLLALIIITIISFNLLIIVKEADGPLSYLYERIIYALDTTNDVGNSMRIISYNKIFEEFTLFGIGIGSTGPAAERFNVGTGYESLILALVAHGGIFVLILFFIITKILIINEFKNKIFISYFIGLTFMCTVSQTLENPNVFNLAMLLILILRKSKNYNIRNKNK